MTATSQTVSVASALSTRLAAHGVQKVFGFPGGGSNLDLIEALHAAGVEFVLTHTEVSAALMAAATAEMTGVPGVVVVGNGPGLASVVNGVAYAHLDRVPLIVISDRYTDAERETTGHQILDQRALLEPVVKWSATLDRDAAATVEHAFTIAAEAPAGAVHLDMPRTLGSEPAGESPPPRTRSREPEGDLRAFARILDEARWPVIVAGLEATRALDEGALQGLAERLRAPVLTTYKAKGVLDERHPLWAGILTGGALERPLLERADAILAVGLDPVELLTKPWPYTAPLVSVRTSVVGATYGAPAALCVDPDLARAVEALTDRAADTRSEWTEEAVGAHREGALDALRIPSDTPLTVWRTVEAIARELPPDTAVAVDAGAHMFAATWFWRAAVPRRFLISNGLATMGFALPAALAAACLEERPALALTGDGGMAYGAFELETAARRNARLIVVVLDDASLSMIRIKHEAKGHDRRRLDFGPVRFDALAGSLGVLGLAADDEEELRLALREAMSHRGPALIDARMSGAEHARTIQVVRG